MFSFELVGWLCSYYYKKSSTEFKTLISSSAPESAAAKTAKSATPEATTAESATPGAKARSTGEAKSATITLTHWSKEVIRNSIL